MAITWILSLCAVCAYEKHTPIQSLLVNVGSIHDNSTSVHLNEVASVEAVLRCHLMLGGLRTPSSHYVPLPAHHPQEV